MPSMTVNGAQLHVEDTGGAGPPVVFAHGLLWSTRLYRLQVAAVRDRYRCVSFDFRGQGQSEVTATGYDMDTLTEDAAALIEALELAPVHFVGLSMGGFVGLRLAARRPELVRSLALLATAADAEPRTNPPRYRLFALLARVLGLRAVARRVMPVMFGSTFLEDPERAELRRSQRAELVSNRVAGVLRALDGVLRREAVESELCRISAPCLVLSGLEDAAIATERSRALAEGLVRAELVTVPDAGHTPTVEQPEVVTAALERFWSGLEEG
jgi:pimeloyl-ACP methyl ester carboxylesterase